MKRLKKYSIFLVPLCLFCVLFAQSFYFNTTSNSSFSRLIPAFVKDSFYLSNENSFSKEKAELGRYFFYDRRLSVNQAKSCASCHDPAMSFTDGYRRSIGTFGDLHQRNAAPLINIVFNKYLTAGDSTIHFPEQQIINPMFHDQPVELGWKDNEKVIIKRFEQDDFYRQRMNELFRGESNPFSVKNMQDCISSFVKSIVSLNSPYDKFAFGNEQYALTADQKKGMSLFFSDRLGCAHCHGGINFSLPDLKDSGGSTLFYFNTGIYNLNNSGDYPAIDRGLYDITENQRDMGAFRVPTLRNLAFTAPYFHDGSAATLDEVISAYERGGRMIVSGPSAGDGSKNPHKHALVSGFSLNADEKKELISFLFSLSDSLLCINPSYSNPFKGDETKQ